MKRSEKIVTAVMFVITVIAIGVIASFEFTDISQRGTLFQRTPAKNAAVREYLTQHSGELALQISNAINADVALKGTESEALAEALEQVSSQKLRFNWDDNNSPLQGNRWHITRGNYIQFNGEPFYFYEATALTPVVTPTDNILLMATFDLVLIETGRLQFEVINSTLAPHKTHILQLGDGLAINALAASH